jgi:hypothetical protein
MRASRVGIVVWSLLSCLVQAQLVFAERIGENARPTQKKTELRLAGAWTDQGTTPVGAVPAAQILDPRQTAQAHSRVLPASANIRAGSAVAAAPIASGREVSAGFTSEDVGHDELIEQASAMTPIGIQTDGCGDCIGCGDCVGDACDGCISGHRWFAGFEATFLQPRFDNNVAFTVMSSNGTSFEDFADAEFDYGLEFSPRAFAGVQYDDGLGLQATWWQFDHEASAASASPPANGFGRITHPPFGDVDISTTIPGDTFTAASGLNAYTIDLEMTKQAQFRSWELGVAGGVRYAHIEQTYLAQTTDSGDDQLGQIDFRHEIECIGPTLSLSGALPLIQSIDFYCRGRGSLLFGEASSRLNAGEDLDLSTPFTTTKNTSRDDLLPIADLQLGLKWNGARRGEASWQPFASVAMEAQHWSGAGNAASETGNLGFFGIAASAGVSW